MTTQFRPIEDLAKKLSVSTSTVRAWTRQGHIPDNAYIKIGQTYRYLVDEAIAGLIKHNAEPNTMIVDDTVDEKETLYDDSQTEILFKEDQQ
jgi:predicted site-specific integrase-resolvase|tara:strand:+ start:261 stop:536 length:276 start_codon:yes stop_codon:yes gene_type:complete